MQATFTGEKAFSALLVVTIIILTWRKFMLSFVYARNFVEHVLSVPGLGKYNLMTQNGASWWCLYHLNLSKSLSKLDD